MAKKQTVLVRGHYFGASLVEAFMAHAEELGVTDEVIHSLVEPRGRGRELAKLAGQKMAEVIAEATRLSADDYIVYCDLDPHLPDGWKIEEHRRSGPVKLEPRGDDLYANGKKIELFLAEGQQEGIEGHQLRKALAEKPVLNANILDYLLKPENHHLIPESWKGKYVFFWGTIYRGWDGNLYVRYLYWDDNRWNWNYNWLDNDFNGNNPAAVSAIRFISPPRLFLRRSFF